VKTGRRRTVPWVLGGAGLLAAGAITTGLVANHHDSQAAQLRDQIERGDRLPADAARYDAAVDSRNDYRTATWVLGGAAVTAGVVGTLLLLFDNPSPEGVQVTPVVGSGPGVTLVGRF
jgi:hypothetical protein